MTSDPCTARRPALDSSYHYPHELLELLVDTIPRLIRSKADLLGFFADAGAPGELLAPWRARVEADRQGVSKFHIARSVLRALNERKDQARTVRREIIRRIARRQDFSTCWDDDRRKAEALVSWVRGVASDKDARTWDPALGETLRRQQIIASHNQKLRAIEEDRRALDELKRDVYGLFALAEKCRGPALVAALPRLFGHFGIPTREPFLITPGGGFGSIELDGRAYLVESRWQAGPIDTPEIAAHLVRVFGRGDAGGIFISCSDYTEATLAECGVALKDRVVILCQVEELVMLLERARDLKQLLRDKVRAAMVDQVPYIRCVEGIEHNP
jgi:hypothetical protein